jgi:small subunit ribosomal protein S2
MIDLKLLIKNGVHFGHQTSKWCPKMKPYIWGTKNNIHIIDVSKTAYLLENAAKFLEDVALQSKTILWVGTKKFVQDIVTNIAKELNDPYVTHRWIGGTFSNYRQIRKSVGNLLHYEDILKKSDNFHFTKKELNLFAKRVERLEKNIGGIRNLTLPIGAVIVVDTKKEHVCIKEANLMSIPVIGIIDTNSDPSLVDYPIPANDDAPKSVSVLLQYLAEAEKRGKQKLASQKENKNIENVNTHIEEPEEEDITKRLLEDEDDSDSENKKLKSKVSSKSKKV